MRVPMTILLILITLTPTMLHAAESFISVSDAHANPSLIGSRNGVLYLTLTNHGAVSDRLIRLETPVAAKAEIHEDVTKDGVMSMKAVAVLPIPAGATVALIPGKYHIMLIGLKAPLKDHESISLSLHFEHAGTVTIDVPVIAPSAMKPMPMRWQE